MDLEMIRYAIYATDTQGTVLNIFKDQRTFKSLPYTKKKLLEMNDCMQSDIGLHIKLFDYVRECPHCKCNIGIDGTEDEYKLNAR